ncbi:MAG TPA: N-acetyl-gamma-glutamyl-phosphate reductase [Stellaceae bacterium]|nr:N-acetyl-gamma-glutamyl-phosphate reductase [Stellaceae bacterium]
MPKRVFIDGESGTTGLVIANRLHDRPDLEILRLAPERRKDPAAREDALNSCDLAILCLPDDAAIEAVGMVENPAVRVLDASSAFRTHPDWVFGFSELTEGQTTLIAEAARVTNPGCYATGGIALLRPLIEAGALPADAAVMLNAVSGYTGGGKSLIAAFEDKAAPGYLDTGLYEYGLSFEHKHVPEIRHHSGMAKPPLFVPSVGRFPRGMLVNLPLQLWDLSKNLSGVELHRIYQDHYAAKSQVRVRPLLRLEGKGAGEKIEADGLAGTDFLDIHVVWNPKTEQALVVAQLDNLGKGACGAAIQNIGLMLGIPDLG